MSQQDRQSQQSSWVSKLVGSFFNRELNKEAAAPVDTSLAVLEELAAQGYQYCEWDSSTAKCFTCQDLHGQVWPIDEFIMLTKHEAPVYSKSHCGCGCSVKVTGTSQLTGAVLPEQIVAAFY